MEEYDLNFGVKNTDAVMVCPKCPSLGRTKVMNVQGLDLDEVLRLADDHEATHRESPWGEATDPVEKPAAPERDQTLNELHDAAERLLEAAKAEASVLFKNVLSNLNLNDLLK